MSSETRPISNSLKGNKLSKTLFKNLITESKIKNYCSTVLTHETEDLNLDRGIQSIGVMPSDIHNYENILIYDDSSDNGLESYPYNSVMLRAMQLEMAVMLYKPSSLLFYNASFWSYPVDYLESLPVENVYVPNDEDLYRAENVYLNREVQVNAVEKTDIDAGLLPDGVDMICVNGINLASKFSQDLLPLLFENLPVNGVIFIDNNNDFLQYYFNGSDTKVENLTNPIYDLNAAIANLEGALVYHIPTAIGFTVIIKQ
jgi:hypothetical protein